MQLGGNRRWVPLLSGERLFKHSSLYQKQNAKDIILRLDIGGKKEVL